MIKTHKLSGNHMVQVLYLWQFTRTTDIPSRQRLLMFTTERLYIPVVRLSTVGCRAFPVTGAWIWNNYRRTLPSHHLCLHL